MEDRLITDFLAWLLPCIIPSLTVYYWQRKQKQRDEQTMERGEARKKESLLSLDLQLANAKLAYAVAKAVQRGEPNGEIEEGIDAYIHAMNRWEEFTREQMTERIFNDQ